MNIKRIPVPNLLSFVAVARHGSINKAAESLNVTQPCLTRCIKRLEEAIGVPLLTRTNHGVILTSYGSAVLKHANRIEQELQNTARTIEELKGGHAKAVLQFGATQIAAREIVPRSIDIMSKRYPNIAIQFIEAERKSKLLADLRSGELNMVLAVMSEDEPEVDCDQDVLFNQELKFHVRSRHQVCRSGSLTLADVQQYSWILPRKDSILYRQLKNVFASARLPLPCCELETASVSVIRGLILRTDIIVAAAPDIFKTECERGDIVSLEGNWTNIRRTVGIYTRRGEELSPQCKAMVKLLKTVTRQYADDHDRATAGASSDETCAREAKVA